MRQHADMFAQDGITLREETEAERGNCGGSSKIFDNRTVLRGKRNRVGAACGGGNGKAIVLNVRSVRSGAGGSRGWWGEAGGCGHGACKSRIKSHQTT